MNSGDDPLYARLFEAFRRQRVSAIDRCRALSACVHEFAEQIHQHLGYPVPGFQSSGVSHPWVRVYELDENSGAVVPLGDRFMIETVSPEGGLSFAVGVALSSTLDSFPKRYFWAGYRIWLHGEARMLAPVWRRGDAWRIGRTDDLAPAVSSFVEVLTESLEIEPYGPTSRKSRSIGFTAEL